MDLRKAAEMALEALEWNYGTDLENIENCMAWLDKMNATIPALRQALSQPEQEPAAWIHTRCGHPLYLSFQYHAEDVPLYTAPPKREWVGVTYDEVYEFVCTTDSYIDFAKAIEAKLKEKNT